MSNKQHALLDSSDVALRRAAPVGMEDGIKQVILRIVGFELFNTRPYHNYENWSDGYRVLGRRDKAAMTLEEVASILPNTIAAGDPVYIEVWSEDLDDACKLFAGHLPKSGS